MITSPEHNRHDTKMEVDLSKYTQDEKVVVFIQEIINDPISARVKRQVNGCKATMIVRAPSHQNRLFIFDVSDDDCTVRDLMVECAVMMNQVRYIKSDDL